MGPADPSVIIAVVTTLGVIGGAALAGRSSMRTKLAESTMSPYAALAERVVALEKSDAEKHRTISELTSEVDRLKRSRRSDAEYIVRAAAWIRAHEPGTYPPPAEPSWLLQDPLTVPDGHA